MKLLALLTFTATLAASAAEPFKLELVDAENGWPVPLVELTTTHRATFITDNAGVVAIDLPELMGRETWFSVRSDGYELPPDGFGNRGLRLTPLPGKSQRIEIRRTMLAKRLGRLTGGGLFSESQKLGEQLDWKESGLFGCDSVQITTHHGKKFWAWGDSNLPRYPLGIFNMSSATTALTPLQSFEPPLRLEFDYFRDEEGRPRGVASIPGKGPTWLNGYLSLPDKNGTPRLVSTYSKIENFLEVYQLGLCVWDDDEQCFKSQRLLWEKSEQAPQAPPSPQGHPTLWTDGDGQRWALFGDPFPNLRIPASYEAWLDPLQWEVLEPQAKVAVRGSQEKIAPHRGSIAWNAYRQRWVSVFTQKNGKPSALGEIWYAEAETPTGRWGGAIKVLSHANYSFYNPRLHQDFTPEGSPILLFEGTYTNTFSNNPVKIPRYDYNQILYRLDLDGPAFKPEQR